MIAPALPQPSRQAVPRFHAIPQSDKQVSSSSYAAPEGPAQSNLPRLIRIPAVHILNNNKSTDEVLYLKTVAEP